MNESPGQLKTDNILRLLATIETVEITTIGRLSGEPRRIEIWMYEIDGRHIITGTPGIRDWYANLLANPNMTLHLTDTINLAVVTTVVDDPVFRRSVFTSDKTSWYRSQTDVEDLVANSPMVEMQVASLG